MACVRVDLDHVPYDGETIKFKAPCDCTAVNSLRLYYPVVTEDTTTTTSVVFSFRDAHKNDLQNVPNLFTEGAYVTAVLDTTNKYAFLQNADNNGFLSRMGRVLFENFSTPLGFADTTTVPGLYRYTVIAVRADNENLIAVSVGTGSGGEKIFSGAATALVDGSCKRYDLSMAVYPDDSLEGYNTFTITDADGMTEQFTVPRIIGIC